MRNISFSMTTEQVRNRTKTVTRRLGWKSLRVGDRLQACVKCMGLKDGESIEKICAIEVVSVSQEKLSVLCEDEEYGAAEAIAEGFPGMSGKEFAEMFCRNLRPTNGMETHVTRIEFSYLNEVEINNDRVPAS